MTQKKCIIVGCVVILLLLAGWMAFVSLCCDVSHVGQYPVNPYCTKCQGRDGIIQHECQKPNGRERYCRTCGKIVLRRLIEKEDSHVEYEENQILIINRKVNYAEGYEDEGLFIDAKGRVYFYCFSQWLYPYPLGTNKEFMQKLKEIQEYSEPILTLEESVISKAMNLCSDIDATETYEKELAAFDYGSRVLYVCNGDDMISCREEGDFDGALNSSAAQKFMKYFDNELLPIIESFCAQMTEDDYTSAKAYYYNENALYFQNIHCGYMENEGKYVVTNEEELVVLEKILGSDLGIGEWKSARGELGNDFIFFVENVNVSSGGYDLRCAGIMCQGGEFTLVPSKDSKVPGPEEIVTEALDGFAFVATVPAEVADLFVDRETGCYFDSDGGEWKRPK